LKLNLDSVYLLDKIKAIFDKWAQNGRSKIMEREHSKTVLKFLNTIKFPSSFSFLDVGCGNGWVVRKISKIRTCKRVVGIDKSLKMIKEAKSKKKSPKESFVVADLIKWKQRGKFDYIFSMESLYYTNPMELALSKIYKLLKPGGVFYCGTDFYKENKATSGWPRKMNLPMDLRSKKQWRNMFEKIGFQATTRQVKDLTNQKKWKREFGTLFVIGKKPD